MRAYQSPIRQFLFGLVGLVLIAASIDVMFGHWISTEPENNGGVLTTRGYAQQRGDIVWGGAMIGVGTLLVGWSVYELVRRRPIAVVTADGLQLRIGSQESDVLIEWSDIRSVAADRAVDPYDGGLRDQLVVDVFDRTGLPDDPIGATWHGTELRVDADGWTKDVGTVALAAQGGLGHHRRVEEIKTMGPPSLVWEVTGEQPPVEAPTAPAPTAGPRSVVDVIDESEPTEASVESPGATEDTAPDAPADVDPPTVERPTQPSEGRPEGDSPPDSGDGTADTMGPPGEEDDTT